MNKTVIKRREENLCIECGNPLDREGLRCRKCLNYKNALIRTHKEEFWRKGICPQRKTRPLERGKKKCSACLEKNNGYQRKWKERQPKGA